MISRRERPKFLNQLCKMCDLQRSLPSSMVIPSIDDISVAPACGGGFADVFQGKYRGRQVAIKVMRVYVSGDRGLDRSVGVSFNALHGKPALTAPPTEVLQRGHRLEAPAAHECSAITRRDAGTKQVCICVGMDG